MGKISYKISHSLIKELLHEAELLIILFTSPPEVQKKWLSKLNFSKKEIKIIMCFSDLFAKRKAELIINKSPKDRKDVILLENDVIESLYEPRLLSVKDESIDCALKDIHKWLSRNHRGGVILNESRINELEDLLKLEGASVDFIVFTKDKILSYQVELINN